MIVLLWNVRGMNNVPREKDIRDFICAHSPYVVFLQETKLSVEGMLSVASKIWGKG